LSRRLAKSKQTSTSTSANLGQIINLVSDFSIYGKDSNYTTWRLRAAMITASLPT
jgi:hypothetical protein